jgi:predicted metalloprotease
MGDSNRDRDTVERERTTIVETGGDRGSGGVLAVVLLIIVLLVLLFLFRDQLGFGGGGTTEVEVPEQIDVTVN